MENHHFTIHTVPVTNNNPFQQPPDSIKKIQHYLFKLNEPVGKGNFSRVYKGINQITNQIVAIKVVDLHRMQTPALHDLLNSQIEILKHLKHPNILNCIEVFKSSNNCYIVTELCNEGDLQSKIRQRGFMPEREISKIIYDIYQGLKYLAHENIVHRDFKIANILFNKGVAKIADFGFAKKTKQRFKDINIGSPIYMSPQGLIDNIYGPKTDVWAFGIMMYQILHGDTPLGFCKTESELRVHILNPVRFENLNPSLSTDLKDLILRCLEVDERKRIHMLQIENTAYMRRITYELFNKQAQMHEELKPNTYENYISVVSTQIDSSNANFNNFNNTINNNTNFNNFNNTNFNNNSLNTNLNYSVNNHGFNHNNLNANTLLSVNSVDITNNNIQNRNYMVQQPFRPSTTLPQTPVNYFHDQMFEAPHKKQQQQLLIPPPPNFTKISFNQKKPKLNTTMEQTRKKNQSFYQNRNINSIQKTTSSNSNQTSRRRGISLQKLPSSKSTTLSNNPSIKQIPKPIDIKILQRYTYLSFQQCVTLLHYCRLVYKNVILLKENPQIGTEQTISVYVSWLFAVFQEIQNKVPTYIKFEGDKASIREKKLKEVINEYQNKYTSQLRMHNVVPTSIPIVQEQCLATLRSLDQLICTQQNTRELVVLAHYLSYLYEVNLIIDKCCTSNDYSLLMRNCSLESFLATKKEQHTLASYQNVKSRLTQLI